MAIYNKTIKNSNGITYTKEVDGPSDWYGIQNNTYFKDLSDDLIYWKDNAGIVIAIYERNLCTTGSTLIGSVVYFDRNDSLSAYTLDLSSLDVNDTFITGMTFNPSTYEIIATRNDGFSTSPIDLSILSADVNVTGGTYDINTGVVTFTNNSGGTFNVSGFTSGMTDSYTVAANISGNSITFDSNLNGPNFYNVDLTPILSGITLTSGNGITIGTGNTIDLGGNLTSNVFIDGLSGSSSMYVGSYGPDKQLSTFSVGANNGISLFNYENNIITSSLGLSDSGVNIFSDVITGTTTVGGGNFLLTTGGGSGNTATVMTPGPGALKYDADYSSGYTSLSLITKNDLDNAISGTTPTGGNGITIGTGNTINLGGALTQPVTIISGSSTELLDIGGNLSGINLAQVRINSTSFQGNHLTAYDGTGSGTYINKNPGEFSSLNNINSTSRTQIINTSGGSSLYFTSNKIFRLYLDSFGGGIPNGSGESYIINGTTFTEGIDFTGQGNYILDAATIAGLNYTGITNFVSVTDEGSGFVKFVFSNPVQVSETLTDGNFIEFNWESSIQTNNNGVNIQVGDDGTYGNPGTILAIGDSQTIFTDNSASPKGIQYGANYDATLVDDSLITKRYVDNAISGTTPTGGNGITIGTGNTVNLGGTLTQPTVISGNSQTFDLGVTGSQLSFFRVNSIQASEEYSVPGYILTTQQNPGGITSVVSNDTGMEAQSDLHPGNFVFQAIGDSGDTYTNLYASNTQGGIISNDLINNSSSYFNINNNGSLNLGVQGSGSTNSSGLDLDDTAGGNGLRFIDGRANGAGLEYDADYSTNFTNRSLVDKEFVDNAINTVSFSGGSGNCISDLYVTNVHGCSPITIKDELIIESGITGTGNIDITGNVISDVVQLRGGVGTQGEMSWSADEETVQLIMDGTTLFLGQDTFVHVRNNTASVITKGTAVYANDTLGASGRITVAPMIADGTIPGRLFIGLAAEDIAIGTDGQVCSYGKIRGINTNTYTDGDVLWISPSVAGQLTTTEPTAPNLKIATAFVIHAATNGTLMVRAEQGTDLHTDQRVQVSGLTNGDVLTWNGTNNRWENEQPIADVITKTSGVFNRTLTLQAPTSSDDITIFRTDVAITVQEVIAVSVGTTPSTTYQLKHSTDRDAAGSNLTTSVTTTSKTTGNIATLSVAAIPANSWVWLETTAASGTNVILTVDIRYTID